MVTRRPMRQREIYANYGDTRRKIIGGEFVSPTISKKGRSIKNKKNDAGHPIDDTNSANKYIITWPQIDL